MNVALHPEYERFIEDQIKAGRFSSPAEAMEAGIARLMMDAEQDILDDQDVTDIQMSLDQIRREDVTDAKTIHSKLRERFTQK
jgi:Arc/MetJ-type ribon-helix-helix transcriptional regulator